MAASEEQVKSALRWVLLGPDHGWGARIATSVRWIQLLAALTLLTHMLDLATGIRMMLVHGVEFEQNPFARTIMTDAGPGILAALKIGVVLSGVLLLIGTARRGRARLARNCLLLTTSLGMLGFASNLVG